MQSESQKNMNAVLLVLACLGATACTTQEHSAPGDKKAPQIAQAPAAPSGTKMIFESDYTEGTTFSVNTTNVVGNQCRDFKAVDVPGRGKNVKAKPGNQVAMAINTTKKLPVAVTARHLIDKKGLYSNCGPLTRAFVLEPNTSYVAKLVKEKDDVGDGEETGICVLDIQKIDAPSGQRVPVRTMAFGQCG